MAKSDEHSSGNGALIRILPIAFYSYKRSTEECYVQEYATLTHGHIHFTICCLQYVYVVHTLEAVYGILLNSTSYYGTIYNAVHLTNDTATIGAIASGLDGAYFKTRTS